MDEQRLALLERAAVEVMSPPHAVTEERRRHAEAAFMELRQSKMPYEACKFMLEKSQSDYVLFQSASTLRSAVVREWLVLSSADKESLRIYLMHYLTARPGLIGYVREQLLHTVAVMVKRATLEDGRERLFNSAFSTVSQLLAMDTKRRLLGCGLLFALLTEYSNSSGSSCLGQPVEFHVRCKVAVQGKVLLRVLVLAVGVLQQYLASPLDWSTLSPDDVSLLSAFLRLSSQILCWDFHHSSLRFHFKPEIHPVKLNPSRVFSSTLLDRDFLAMFFKLLGRLRGSEDHTHHVVQCLTQLASLSRPLFATEEEGERYLASFVSEVLGYVASSSQLNQQELYGLSCILRRLTSTYRCFDSLGAERLELFVRTVKDLTILSSQRTVQGEESLDDPLLHQESLEHFLEVWIFLLSDTSSLPPPLLLEPCTHIFNTFVLTKLATPTGWRTPSHDEDEILELDEDDRTAFADQLCSIGCVARHAPDHALRSLSSLLGQRALELTQLHGAVVTKPGTLASHEGRMEALHEDVHWLVLVAGYTLCDIVQGEDVFIPDRLMQHSILNQAHYQSDSNSSMTLSELVCVKSSRGMTDDARSKVDPIVDLVATLLLLCEVEGLYLEHGHLELLSPQLSETLVWCLSCVSEPYLMISEESYGQISLSLLSVFGQDSQSALWMVSFLLNKVLQNLHHWQGEESVMLTSIQLLRAIVKSPVRAAVALQSDNMWRLMKGFASGQQLVGSLPPSIQRSLMSGLVVCGMAEKSGRFLAELLEPIRHRFTVLIQSPDFHTRFQNGEMQHALLSILDALCGLAEKATPTFVEHFFSFLMPFLQTAVSLLEAYAGIAEVVRVVLELFSLVAENYVVFLSPASSTQLYEVSLALINMYAKCNTGKYSRLGLAEAEQCEDLLWFMRMLSHLTTKDFLDLGEPDDSSGVAVEPVAVVIAGINIILPMMNEEILKFPTLCKQFYSLIGYVCEMFPEKMATLPEALFNTFVQLLEAGFTKYGSDICVSCLEAVSSMATHYGSHPRLHSSVPLTQSLQHLLKVTLEFVLESSFDLDLIGPASSALFALICIQKAHYTSLAESLVAVQSDAETGSRLLGAFGQLTPASLPLNLSRSSRQQFRKNLTEFLPLVKGFLCFR